MKSEVDIFCNRVILISPTYFTFDKQCAEDDKFQHESSLNNIEVDELAKEEHKAYVKTIIKAGINVQLYQQHDLKAIDAVYPDWFTIQRGNICPSGMLTIFPMHHPSRRIERDPKIISELSKECKHILDLTKLEENGEFLEGKGSILYDHRNCKIYCCLSSRSSETALEKYVNEINKISENKWQSVTFKAKDKNGDPIYHTDCMMQILKYHVILCGAALEKEDKEKLIDELSNPLKNIKPYEKIIDDISLMEMSHMCCNIINIRNNKDENVILMSKQAYKNFNPEHRKLLKESYKLVFSDLETIEEVGGGSARCLLAKYF